MGFVDGQPKIWPVAPHWRNAVRESLAWATDVLQASATAATSHRGYRIGPARSFSFDVLAEGREHRALDMLKAGHRGTWLLPIWHDVQWLGAALAAGVDQIPCNTAGYDFVAGGRALLYRNVNSWELVEIDAIETDHLALTGNTSAAYGPGDRLYPLRRAILNDGAQIRMLTDRDSLRAVAFDVAEPCDWTVLASPTEYLTYPVLDTRPDETDEPMADFAGLQQLVDYGTGAPVLSDLPDIALRGQSDQWRLQGRSQHTWFRSLLYTLRGRQRPIWVPSWQSDLAPVAAIAGGSTALTVEWAGYTLFGLDRPNRKDLRIELRDGTVFYRRVASALEVGNTETLTLDASLDVASIAPGSIRQISIMALCTLASDSTEISHVTDADGLATAATGWQAVVPDV